VAFIILNFFPYVFYSAIRIPNSAFASPYRQGNHPRHDCRRRREPPAGVSLGQHPSPHDRPDQNADLSLRRNVTDGCSNERG
jgi:hypothetical protein